MKRLLPLYATLFFAFLHLPIATLAVFSFNDSRFTVWQGVSLRWYRAAFADPQLMEAALNSLTIAVAATALSTVVGTLCAYALWKRRAPVLSTSLYLSLVTPEIVTGVSLLAFFQFVFRFTALRLGMHTVVLAHVSFCVAYVVLVVLARLRTLDPALEESAMDLGATEWQAFRSVTLPMLAPAVVAAALLAFTISFDDYVTYEPGSTSVPLWIAGRGASPVKTRQTRHSEPLMPRHPRPPLGPERSTGAHPQLRQNRRLAGAAPPSAPVRSLAAPSAVADGQAPIEPYIMPLNHGEQDSRAYPVHRPMPTLTSVDAWALVEPCLVKYYGTADARPIDEPLDTVTSFDRFGLVIPEKNGYTLDIRFRMLQPHELAGAGAGANRLEPRRACDQGNRL